MVQSFDPTALSLNQVADMVAIRAQLGVAANAHREKQSFALSDIDMGNPLHAALVGGGVGAGGGLLATLMSKRKKKKWLRNALLGGALGAGVGGAGSYIAKHGPGFAQTENSALSAKYDNIKATLQSVADTGRDLDGNVLAPEAIQKLTESLTVVRQNMHENGIGPGMTQKGEGSSRWSLVKDDLSAGNYGDVAKNILGWGTSDLTADPESTATTAGLTGGGALAGHALDKLRAKRYEAGQAAKQQAEINKPITAADVRNPTVMKESLPKKIQKQIRKGVPDAPEYKPGRGRPIPTPIKLPLVGEVGTIPKKLPVPGMLQKLPGMPSHITPRRAPPPGPSGKKILGGGIDLGPNMDSLTAAVRRMRTASQTANAQAPGTPGAKPQPSRLGRAGASMRRNAGMGAGAGLGAAASLFSNWGSNPAEAARSSR